MKAALVNYPQSITPEGGFVIERPSHGQLERAMTDYDAAETIQSIGYQAWSNSGWVQEIAATHDLDPGQLTRRAFNLDRAVPKVEEQLKRVEKSDRLRNRAVIYWFGEVLKVWPEGVSFSDLPGNPWTYFAQGYPHGFIKIERQASNNRLLYVAKRAANLGISACIHDINVVPEMQGKGLGTAMAYVGLEEQPKDMKSSLYTAANNEPMRAWAEKYGYKVKDEYEDNDLFDGISVPFVHYAAKSVRSVLRRMLDINPWLDKGKKTSMLGRVMDEWETEMMSINPRGLSL